VKLAFFGLLCAWREVQILRQHEQTSKHGGGGRYNAILEFKGEQIKKLMRKKKMRKGKKEKEIKKKKYMYEEKRKEKI
jgi:hypothetical protein